MILKLLQIATSYFELYLKTSYFVATTADYFGSISYHSQL